MVGQSAAEGTGVNLDKTSIREIFSPPKFDVELKVIYIYRFLELFLRFVDFLKHLLEHRNEQL